MKGAGVVMRALAGLVICSATCAWGKVDPACHSGCLAQGYVADFCTQSCTYDPEKGTRPAFGGPVAPEPPPPAPVAPPPERKPQPPTATLEALNPAREGLRDELRRLRAENASLKKELTQCKSGSPRCSSR